MTTRRQPFRRSTTAMLLISLLGGCPVAFAQEPPVLLAQLGGLLQVGDQGDAVVQLQTQLRRLGYYQGAIDGDFGSGTEAAVIQFQRAQNLTPDGIVGPQTSTALDRAVNPDLPPPSSGPTEPTLPPQSGDTSNQRGGRFSIVELQRRLQARGLYQGPLDGILGTQTRAAIRAAQQRYRLEADDILNGRF